MSTPQQPMTRSQRREELRAAEAAARRSRFAGPRARSRAKAPGASPASEWARAGVGHPADAVAVPLAPSVVGRSRASFQDLDAGERTGLGHAARAGVMIVLAVVTVVAPLSGRVAALPAGLQTEASLSTSVPTASGSSSALPTSVAAAVLGSDADVAGGDGGADTALSNVPDAATLARIRDAYAKASVTCTPQAAGASGDTAAFTSTPEIFLPMAEGTYTVSSPYGYRIHPTLGTLKLHAGQDYSAAAGTPIYAVATGEVVAAGMVSDTGTVTIKHEINGETWYTSYLHMYQDGIYVKKGDTVQAGQLIAGVGSTGQSTGPHLHLEVRTKDDAQDETTVEPEQWLKDHGAVDRSSACT